MTKCVLYAGRKLKNISKYFGKESSLILLPCELFHTVYGLHHIIITKITLVMDNY